MLRSLTWCALAFGALIGAASAQTNYPERPIRLVIAFVPGGATDTMTRQITEDLKKALGQPVIVENRPGANGYIAWNHVASSDPDGYTLLMAENALAISQGLFKKASSSFDPVTQYDAIAGVANSPLVLVAANKVTANTVAELAALSHANPGKMNYASAGIGSVAHLTFEVLKEGAGIDAMHIPYKGGGQAIGDVIGGQVDMNMAAVSVGKSLIETNKVKGLVVTSLKRSPAVPQVPSISELGMKFADVDLRFWWGVFGPKNIPEPVKAKIEKAVQTVMSDPDVRARLAKLDMEPEFIPGSALKVKLQNEIKNWTTFIDAHGIKAE